MEHISRRTLMQGLAAAAAATMVPAAQASGGFNATWVNQYVVGSGLFPM